MFHDTDGSESAGALIAASGSVLTGIGLAAAVRLADVWVDSGLYASNVLLVNASSLARFAFTSGERWGKSAIISLGYSW